MFTSASARTYLLLYLLLSASPLLGEDEKTVIFTHSKATAALQKFGKPEYESGKALYEQVCLVCHGNLQKPPVNETVRRFHEVPLQNGPRPIDIYQTLTKGYKTMAPQPWMTARQKYEIIHYIREEFFKEHNPSQYIKLDKSYIKSLRGSEFSKSRFPWHTSTAKLSKKSSHSEVDQGRALFGHFEVTINNTAPKGVVISLDPKAASVSSSTQNALYDLDTGRLAAFWKSLGSGPVTWTDLSYNGQHSYNARIAGELAFETPEGIAWTRQHTPTPGQHVDFRDPRKQALDGRHYGPLPKDHLEYKGLFVTNNRPALHFKVNGTDVIETPWHFQSLGIDYYVRSISIAPHDDTMHLRFRGKNAAIAVKYFFNGAASLIGSNRVNDGIAAIRPSDKIETIHIVTSHFKNLEPVSSLKFKELLLDGKPVEEVLSWPELPKGNATSYLAKSYENTPSIETTFEPGSSEGAFKVDNIPLPQTTGNPWKTRIRPSGIDFLDEDTAAVSSWTGDVFVIQNIQGKDGKPVRISRIAAGLHQPLGLKVQNGEIFVSCRDQIMRPHDLDGDAVADYYEAFNTDHVVTMHFHDFGAGLDTDAEGNFYYVKCSQHQAPAVHERHGTLIKVSPDGKKSEIVAIGLRSCNGCFVDKDGTVWLTDQEGYWNPQNKIMRIKPGAFHGNMLGWHDNAKISPADKDMVEPMVWTIKEYANSPSEVFRFPEQGWGPLNNKLGYFGYGRGHLMLLADEKKGENIQGFTHRLDLPAFPTGIMRGRFHPADQALYTCGLFSWGSNRNQTGGLFRVTPTGKPSYSLTGISTSPGKLTLSLSDAIKADSLQPSALEIKSYYIQRSKHYGSKLDHETTITVESLEVSPDGKSITLDLPTLEPSRIIMIKAQLPTPTGVLKREFHGSLYNL